MKVTVITPIAMPEPPGPPTPGMERRQVLDEGDRWIGWVRTTPGMASGWHHHGDRDTYIFVGRGTLIVEFGPGGRESVTMSAGEMGYVPPRIGARTDDRSDSRTTCGTEGPASMTERSHTDRRHATLIWGMPTCCCVVVTAGISSRICSLRATMHGDVGHAGGHWFMSAVAAQRIGLSAQ